MELWIVDRGLDLTNDLLSSCARAVPCLRQLLYCRLVHVVDLAACADYGTACALLRVDEGLSLRLGLRLRCLQSQAFDLIHYCRQVLVTI